ncbi:LAGLIDADG family homing endonuclease, partial [Neobacillus drentensis]|uniref:LAGLIDADG family homing endonuclease n=1 Tax=Neobacillus drentensis TaxID=220684 RepID=UPI003001F1A6
MLSDKLSKVKLIDLYVVQGLSTIKIAKMYNVTKGTVLNLMKLYDIPRRNEKESHYKYSVKYSHGVTKEVLEFLYVNLEWSIQMIANIFKISYITVNKYLKEFEIPIRDISAANKVRYKYDCNVNIDFFKTLTPDLAYILGLIATDGSVGDNGEIALGLIDEDVINWVAKKIGYTRKIHRFHDGNKNHNTRYMIHFTNQDVADALRKYEIVPRKTNIIKFPSLPDNVIRDYIRGVFDGDGTINPCVKLRKKKEGVTCNPEVNIVSASLHFIEGIKKVIDSALDIDYKITLNRRDNLYYYR